MTEPNVQESERAVPAKLHRVNAYDAMIVMLKCSADVRGGEWIDGAPTHVLAEFMQALASRGYYLGIADESRYEGGTLADCDRYRDALERIAQSSRLDGSDLAWIAQETLDG